MSFGATPVQGTAGWFDDPYTPGVTRYWDGDRWTERSFGEPLQYAPRPAGTGGGRRSLGPQYPPGFVPSTERGPRPGAQTDSGAIWSLVLGIVACVLALACVGLFVGIPAITMGGKAKRRIRYSGGRLTGEGMATAGQILGWVAVVLVVSLLVIGFAIGATSEPTYQQPR